VNNAERQRRRVFVIDDHPVVREGFRSMLTDEGIEIVGEAATGAEAIGRITTVGVDLILLDLKLPDIDGVALLRRLKEIIPAAPVLVISIHDDPPLVRRAVEAGAAGYALKGIGRRELVGAIHAVCDGEAVLDPGLLRAIVGGSSGVSSGNADDTGRTALTRVEVDLLRLMAEGMTNAQISERMRWSLATTKRYVQSVLEKLDVSDRTQAAVTAVRLGLLA
jgi:DNA-binding NarL/FixJ family response regulator